MPNIKNTDIVQGLEKKLTGSTGVLVAAYSGVNANSFNKLRDAIAGASGYTEVAKNTLMKIALKETGLHNADLDMFLKEQTVTVICTGDPFAMLKRLYDFSKENEKFVVKAGLMDNMVYTGAQLEAISKLPSKEVLIAKMIGGLISPIYGIVNVLSGPHRNFVYALSAIATKKEVA